MRSIKPDLKRTLIEASALHTPYIHYEGRDLLNFSSNDYLGLSHHSALIEGAIEAARRFGTSSSSSRVLTGSHPLHMQIEERLKELIGKEILLFNTGYQLNSGLLKWLNAATLLLDHSAHRSLIEGALASGSKVQRFRHNDMNHLERLLKSARGPVWIVTESLFSMEGDLAPLNDLIALKERYGASLIVDDAHAIGVMGPQGMGLAAHQEGIDISLATFGKAMGSFGAFVACSQEQKEQLIQYCPSFIYTTALPPPTLGAIDAALQLVPTLDAERAHLKKLYEYMGGSSQIIPYPVGEADAATRLSKALKERGILALAIRPPTVTRAILRLSLTACHSQLDLTLLQSHLNSGLL